MVSNSSPTLIDDAPEQWSVDPVVIDKADLEELIGSVVCRDIANLPVSSATLTDGGMYVGMLFLNSLCPGLPG